MIYIEYKDQANRLTVALPELPESDYSVMKNRITDHFHLHAPQQDKHEFCYDSQKVTIDWDMWSGFCVTAINHEAEHLVKAIGCYLRDSETPDIH